MVRNQVWPGTAQLMHLMLGMMRGSGFGLVRTGPTDAHDARHVCGSEASLASTAPADAHAARRDAWLGTRFGQERPS